MRKICGVSNTSKQNEGHICQPAPWWELYKQDITRYKKHRRHVSTLRLMLAEQGLWALLQYRVASAIYRSQLPKLAKSPLLLLVIAWLKLVEMTTGISLSHKAKIGPGLYIGHFGNIFVGEDAVIGHTCNIAQGVTIGVSGLGQRRGTPRIGNRVYIAPNAVVVGKITVGDDAMIAANSLATDDVAPHTTVIGVPAQFKSAHGSEGYLDPLD
jgi:serine O-acetyltransferase